MQTSLIGVPTILQSPPTIVPPPPVGGGGAAPAFAGGWFEQIPQVGPLAGLGTTADASGAISNTVVGHDGKHFQFLKEGREWQNSIPLDFGGHPCKNGGDCGCGGTCKATNRTNRDPSSVNGSIAETSKRNLDENPGLKQLLTNNFKVTAGMGVAARVDQGITQPARVTIDTPVSKLVAAFDVAKEGNIFTFSCQYDTGVTETIISEVERSGVVRVRINDISNLRNILDIRYHLNGGYWMLNNRIVVSAKDANLAKFGLGAWISFYTLRSSLAHDEVGPGSRAQENAAMPGSIATGLGSVLGYPAPRILSAGGGGDNDIMEPEPPGGPCINHNLICDFPVPIPQWGFTGPKIGMLNSDQKTMWFAGFPCILPIEINIADCCFTHDIAYWCSSDRGESRLADNNVAGCVAGRLINAILDAYDNFWSMLCMGLVTIFDPWVTLATLFDFGVVYVETIAEIVTALEIFAPYDASKQWKFGPDGIHKDSCLCGGTLPTAPCRDDKSGMDKPMTNRQKECRDLCLEIPAAKEREKCINCGWKCNYERLIPKGYKVTKSFDPGENNPTQKKCCFGTSQYCTQDFIGPDCPPVPHMTQ